MDVRLHGSKLVVHRVNCKLVGEVNQSVSCIGAECGVVEEIKFNTPIFLDTVGNTTDEIDLQIGSRVRVVGFGESAIKHAENIVPALEDIGVLLKVSQSSVCDG